MNDITNGACPLLDLVLEGVSALNTPQGDREMAVLILADNLRMMRPEGKHLRAIVDLMEDAA